MNSGARVSLAGVLVARGLSLAAAALGATFIAAEPAPAFVGVLTLDRENLLALQPEPGAPAVWRRVGERVGPYRVVGYDPIGARVTLFADRDQLVLPLREARVQTAPPPALDAPEGQRLVRAAFQALFDTGQLSVTVTDAELHALTLALDANGTPHLLDAIGRPLAEDSARPVHILVPADTGLEEIARRFRQPIAQLAFLNPAFEPGRDATAKHTVRIR